MPKIVDHDARRRELARAAWRVAGRDGLDGLTTRAVAREAGWSSGVLAHYFDNRDGLLLAAFRLVYEDVMERMQATVAAEPDPTHALIAALQQAIPIDAQQRNEAIVWFSFLGLAAGQPALRDEARLRYNMWVDLIEGAVDAIFNNHRLAPGDARRIARVLVSHVDGLTVQALFDPTGLPVRRLKAELGNCIRATLQEISAKPLKHFNQGRGDGPPAVPTTPTRRRQSARTGASRPPRPPATVPTTTGKIPTHQ